MQNTNITNMQSLINFNTSLSAIIAENQKLKEENEKFKKEIKSLRLTYREDQLDNAKIIQEEKEKTNDIGVENDKLKDEINQLKKQNEKMKQDCINKLKAEDYISFFAKKEIEELKKEIEKEKKCHLKDNEYNDMLIHFITKEKRILETYKSQTKKQRRNIEKRIFNLYEDDEDNRISEYRRFERDYEEGYYKDEEDRIPVSEKKWQRQKIMNKGIERYVDFHINHKPSQRKIMED